MLTAIDPGRDTGWAVFENESLCRCELGSPLFYGAVYIELPQIYQTGKARPQDLITLAVNVGELKARAEDQACTVTLVWPHAWKGSIKKEVMNGRILATMREDELCVFKRATYRLGARVHNVIDAIGIGLWALDRL